MANNEALNEAKQLAIVRIPHKIEATLKQAGQMWTLTVKPKEPNK